MATRKTLLGLLVCGTALAIAHAQIGCKNGAKFENDPSDCHFFFACVGPIPHRMSCPGDLVFSLKLEKCVYRDDPNAPKNCVGMNNNVNMGNRDDLKNNFDDKSNGNTGGSIGNGGAANRPSGAKPNNGGDGRSDDPFLPNVVAVEQRCWNGATTVAHATYCHRYYNCSAPGFASSNRYLTPYEAECPYPMLFSMATMKCEPFDRVDCGQRTEYTSPCEYSENMCSGPHCKQCIDEYPSCVGLPDGLNYWKGREGSGFWSECRSGRTMAQGNCGTDSDGVMMVFSQKASRCVKHHEMLKEICEWTGGTLPHLTECQLYYNCTDISKVDDYSKVYASVCPYPQLYSLRTHRCEDFSAVSCDGRREAKSPCEYGIKCVDPAFASCVELLDGNNVFRTREGSPHYVVCRGERTVGMDMCPRDARGFYQQFAPGPRACMPVGN